ncbi:MAG: hypothetical protein QM758_12805 [Armatimonas sp.]
MILVNENWKNLKVGDLVKIVRLPSDYNEELDNYDRELIGLYSTLMERGQFLAIDHIDEYGKPWVDFTIEDGKKIAYHSLALNDDSWEYVPDQDRKWYHS